MIAAIFHVALERSWISTLLWGETFRKWEMKSTSDEQKSPKSYQTDLLTDDCQGITSKPFISFWKCVFYILGLHKDWPNTLNSMNSSFLISLYVCCIPVEREPDREGFCLGLTDYINSNFVAFKIKYVKVFSHSGFFRLKPFWVIFYFTTCFNDLHLNYLLWQCLIRIFLVHTKNSPPEKKQKNSLNLKHFLVIGKNKKNCRTKTFYLKKIQSPRHIF